MKMSRYGLNQKKLKEGKGLQGWCTERGTFPPGWVMLRKFSYCPCLKAQPWLPAEGRAHCGENKAGWAVLHCHGLSDRGSETEAFVNFVSG